MGGRPTILLVEDNPDHAEITRRCIRKLTPPPEVQHVLHGEAALDYLFRRKPYDDPAKYPWPRVILLDLRLPRLSGIEVLRTIKTHATLRQIPVVALTSSDRPQDLEAAYALHVNGYLVKPVEFKDYHRLLQDFGRFWLTWNRIAHRAH